MENFDTEYKAQRLIGKIVRILVITAAGFAIAGGAVYIYTFGRLTPSYGTFHPVHLRTIHDILKSAFSLDSSGIIQLGILILIAIPIIRTAAFLTAFLFQADRLYSIVTSIVLLILLYSFFAAGF